MSKATEVMEKHINELNLNSGLNSGISNVTLKVFQNQLKLKIID